MTGKVKATLLLLAMYALGLLSGVVWQNYRNPRFSIHQRYASRRIQKLKKELKLTPDQEKALAEIFKKAHERAKQVNEEVSWDLADIHRDSVAAIKNVLTPEQCAKFDQLHKRYHERREEPAEDLTTSDSSEVNSGAAS